MPACHKRCKATAKKHTPCTRARSLSSATGCTRNSSSSAPRSSSPQLPIHTTSPSLRSPGWGKNVRASAALPDPCALGPAAREIDVTQHAAEGEHTIVVTQVVTRHVFWLGQRTMVGSVKQEARTRMGGAIFADTTHELMIVPFVHDDEVGAVDQLADLILLQIVNVAHVLGKVPMKVGERARSLIAEEMGETPSAVRFIYLHLVPARLEFAHHATQEVGIAVIPVGHQRVIEHHDTHGWPSLAGAHAARVGSSLNMER